MSNVLNSAIEFHDSKLAEIIQEDEHIVVLLTPAYVHRSAGRPGVDDGVGGLQASALLFNGGRLEGDPGELSADITQGDLRIGGTELASLLPLPYEAVDTPVELRLVLFDGRRIVLFGEGLQVHAEGGFDRIERFIA